MLTCSPLVGLARHSETKTALLGWGGGSRRDSGHALGSSWQEEKSVALPATRRALASHPSATDRRLEPVGGMWCSKVEGGSSLGSRSREVDSSSRGLTLQLMALVGVDVNVKKVGCWGQPGTDPTRVWWEKGRRYSAPPSQSWCHSRKRHTCLLPPELEENTGLLPVKLTQHLSDHWWA